MKKHGPLGPCLSIRLFNQSVLEFKLQVFLDAIDRGFEFLWGVVGASIDLVAYAVDEFCSRCRSSFEFREVTSDA